MNLVEMIKLTGSLPLHATLSDGTEIELYVHNIGSKGYRATLITIVDGMWNVVIDTQIGNTSIEAQNNLKESILKKEL